MFAKTLTNVIVTATVLCGCNPDETKVTVETSALKSAVEGNVAAAKVEKRLDSEIPFESKDSEKGRVVSQLIRLNYITADEAQKSVEAFKDPNGLFHVLERINAILVTDTQENINRMLEIIKELDVPKPVLEDVFERQIKYAKATDIKTYLETIVTEPPQPIRLLNLNNRPGLNKPGSPPSTPNAVLTANVSDADRGMIRGKVLIVADDRSNKLIIITAKTNMGFFDKVISALDVETTPEFDVDVIRLKYAEAEDVEKMRDDAQPDAGGLACAHAAASRRCEFFGLQQLQPR